MFQLRTKRSSAVAPALVIENESACGTREGWADSSRAVEDSEIELPLPETTDSSKLRGPPHGIDDII